MEIMIIGTCISMVTTRNAYKILAQKHHLEDGQFEDGEGVAVS
jgi:hypothetical protein